jgi:hypothetical protein
MKWVLVWIALNHHPLHTVSEQGRYDTMRECFDVREQIVDSVGKPIVNYQVVCVPYDRERLLTLGKPQPQNKYK